MTARTFLALSRDAKRRYLRSLTTTQRLDTAIAFAAETWTLDAGSAATDYVYWLRSFHTLVAPHAVRQERMF